MRKRISLQLSNFSINQTYIRQLHKGINTPIARPHITFLIVQ